MGETLDFQVEAGNRILRFTGLSTGLTYPLERRFVRGELTSWEAETQRGHVHLLSRLAEAAELQVDGEEPLRIEPGRERVVTLDAGEHRLVVRGLDSGDAYPRAIRLTDEAVITWELLPLLGHVRVENRTLEPLTITLDGEPLGRVEAESHETYGPWSARMVSLAATGTRTGTSYRAVLEVHGGVLEPWVINPNFGVVRIVNRRDEAVRVLIDRDHSPDLPAGESVDVELPLGQHRVELVGVRTRRSFLQAVAVRPDRAVPVEAPAHDHAVRVVNRSDEALVLRDEERVIGEVAAGETRVVALPEGRLLAILAVGQRSGRTWQRRLNAASDRLIDWEIDL